MTEYLVNGQVHQPCAKQVAKIGNSNYLWPTNWLTLLGSCQAQLKCSPAAHDLVT